MKHFKTIASTVLASTLVLATSSTVWALGIRPAQDTARTPSNSAPTQTQPSEPSQPSQPSSVEFKALWSGKHSDANNWTLHAIDAIERYGDNLLKGSSDMDDFCPMYDRLGHREQVYFWVELVAAMAKFESGFKPTTRYTESTMGTDPITGKQVVSEGLLQLSYQDERNYRKVLPAEVCDFDFDRDQQYALNDIRRTILDPKTNLTCGIAILNRQLLRYGKISIDKGAYWSVLKPNGRRIPEIRKITQALSFCK